jgi:hypothetical protein
MSSRLRAQGLAFGLVTAVFVSLSCQAIVTSDVPQFTCDGTAGSCPAGKYCKGVGCADCESQDVCDGYDNDCNGKIDDGPASDADGDGYTKCGTKDGSGGFGNIDCDDSNDKVHPGASEVCNGVDDDCNNVVDESSCTLPTVCVGRISKCVVPCEPSKCPPGQFCDTITLQCVQSTPQDIGAACISTAECKAGLDCYPKDTLTTAVLPDPQKGMCTKPCCTSEDCPRDYVCYAPGNGGKYCVSGAKLGRASVAGAKGPGASAGAASECRSGAIVNGKCSDTCCNDGQCSNGTHCQYATADGHNSLYCRDWPGTKGQDGTCGNGGSQCRSGQCATVISFWYTDRCLDWCCNQSACTTLLDGTLNPTPSTCSYVLPNANVNEPAPLCLIGTGGPKKLGEACTKNDDCASFFCANLPNGYCTDPCCTDADCAKAGMKCGLVSNRPRCVKP